MHPIDQDEDGYTSRPFDELMANPPEPERDWIDTRITDTERALTEKYGPGAIWPPVPPASTPGAAPWSIERWNLLWDKLAKAGHTAKAQRERFRRMAEIAKGQQGNTKMDPVAFGEFKRLELAIHPPVVPGLPPDPLWAFPSEFGIVLLAASSDDILPYIDTHQSVALKEVRDGTLLVGPIGPAIQFPATQAAYWAWAAWECRYLYRFADADAAGAAPPSETSPTNKTSVVRPEPPSFSRTRAR